MAGGHSGLCSCGVYRVHWTSIHSGRVNILFRSTGRPAAAPWSRWRCSCTAGPPQRRPGRDCWPQHLRGAETSMYFSLKTSWLCGTNMPNTTYYWWLKVSINSARPHEMHSRTLFYSRLLQAQGRCHSTAVTVLRHEVVLGSYSRGLAAYMYRATSYSTVLCTYLQTRSLMSK